MYRISGRFHPYLSPYLVAFPTSLAPNHSALVQLLRAELDGSRRSEYGRSPDRSVASAGLEIVEFQPEDATLGIEQEEGAMPLREDELIRIGNVILGLLCNRLSIPQIRLAVGRAGFDAGQIRDVDSRASVVPAVQRLFTELPYDQKLIALPILAESIQGDEVVNLLRRHGYQLVNEGFVPVTMLDERELQFLPTSSAERISQAFSRLLDGDENGAITAACGAVDSATISIYAAEGLGNPPNSFQAKVNTVMDRLGIYDEMRQDLQDLGVDAASAQEIADELRQATIHASNALQVIRRTLGDVHGQRPSYTHLTYETIKWASAICGLLEGKI